MNTPATHLPQVLVVTDSKHGSTREIGDIVQQVLSDAGLHVDHLNAGAVDGFGGYDAVVFGSAVYLGHWLPDLRRLVDDNAQELTLVPVWLFESGPLGDPPVPAAPSEDLTALGRQLSASTRVFPGRLEKESLGIGERVLTRLVRAPYGDFRPVDEIKEWASSIATFVGAVSPRH